jgi:glucokinase
MLKRYALALDMGGTNIRSSIIAEDGTIAVRTREATGEGPAATAAEVARKLVAEHDYLICGIGIAVAGIIEQTTGTVLRSPNIPALANCSLKKLFVEQFRLPVSVANDANAAALGEKWVGAGKNFDNFVLLTLGTGIGCGVVQNGSLLPIAAEAGHMSIAGEGPTCGCGNGGCLEQFASASAIISRAMAEIEKGTPSLLRELYQGNFYKITAEDVYTAALEGDALARTTLRDAGRALGVGIANLINLFSPDAVIVTGGLTGAWNIYGEAATAEAARRALPELYQRTEILVSPVFDDAGLLGAARLVFQKIAAEGSDEQPC